MTFPEVRETEKAYIIDGYSNAKTENGALADFGRWIAKNVNKEEGEATVKFKQETLISSKDSQDGYFLEIENVPCASRYINDDEIEYKDGNFYLCCKILK